MAIKTVAYPKVAVFCPNSNCESCGKVCRQQRSNKDNDDFLLVRCPDCNFHCEVAVNLTIGTIEVED